MKNKTNRIYVTHIVNPHHFYFKYLNECASSEYSKFDVELQLYGNKLHAENKYANGYLPTYNELVIFYHVIFNKWIRGRVIKVGHECVFWCIDTGTFESSSQELVLPIIEPFRENMKLVHSGGLSLLPAEKKLIVETLDIEMQLSTKWDDAMMSTFKRIIDTSKSIVFTEELEFSNHKLGLLTIESKGDKIFAINNTFMEMSKAVPCSEFSKELSSYISKDRLEEELFRSYNHDSTISSKLNLTNAVSCSSIKDITMTPSIDNSAPSESYEDFDDSASMALSSNTLENGSKSSSTSNTHLSEERIDYISSEITKMSLSNSLNSPVQSKAVALSGTDNESYDGYQDSASIVLSSTTTIANDKKSSQSSSLVDEEESERSPASNIGKGYECFSYTCTINRGKKLRQPFEATINRINSFPNWSENYVLDETKSNVSSIINLNDDGDSSESLASPTPSVSTKLNRRKMLAAVLKRGTEDENDINSNIPKNKFVNFERNQIHGVPAGYPKNRLETFGGLTKRN